MTKFKAGDRVYCPRLGTEIYEVKKSDMGCYTYNIICPATHEQVEFIVTGYIDPNDKIVFHATPENKQALETLYGMEFEAV